MVRLAYDFALSPTLLGRANIGYNRFGNINESVFVENLFEIYKRATKFHEILFEPKWIEISNLAAHRFFKRYPYWHSEANSYYRLSKSKAKVDEMLRRARIAPNLGSGEGR